MPLLQIDNLQVRFPTPRGLIRAVDGLSLSLERGETVCLLGESGSGKSVTGFSIMRLLQAAPGLEVEGRVLFEGQDLLALKDREMRKLRGREIAMIFQEPMSALNPVMTIGEQIAETIRLHRKQSRRRALQSAGELLEMVGFPDPGQRLRSFPHQLSGGMRQRAMIAITIACQPKLLIADEPTTALDVTIQAQILSLLADLQKQNGMSVLFVTHDLGVAAEVADRICVMYAGRIVEMAPAAELLDLPGMPYTRGLLDSLPDRAMRRRLEAIAGQAPDPSSRLPGCAFHPRCPHATWLCQEVAPGLEKAGKDRWIRCLRWRELEAAEQGGAAA